MSNSAGTQNALFRCSVKVRRGPTCDMPPHLIGAFVDCFFAAHNYEDGLRQVVAKLRERGYIFQDVVDQRVDQLDPLKWNEYVTTTWSEVKEHFLSQSEMEQFVKEGGVFFGPFICWDHE
jgi:hypothetical protein